MKFNSQFYPFWWYARRLCSTGVENLANCMHPKWRTNKQFSKESQTAISYASIATVFWLFIAKNRFSIRWRRVTQSANKRTQCVLCMRNATVLCWKQYTFIHRGNLPIIVNIYSGKVVQVSELFSCFRQNPDPNNFSEHVKSSQKLQYLNKMADKHGHLAMPRI